MQKMRTYHVNNLYECILKRDIYKKNALDVNEMCNEHKIVI